MYFIPLGLWIVFWLWLLVDCIRRDRFPPIFGHGRANRVVWLLLLVTLDPLLSFLYFLMVKFWWGRDSGWTRWGVGVSVALVILGWVDLGVGTAPRDLERDSVGEWQGRSMLVAVSASVDFHQMGASVSSSLPGTRGALMPAREVELLMSDAGPVTAGLAQLLAAELQKLPFVRRIDVRKQGETRQGRRGPDLRIRVFGADVEWLFPFRASPSSLVPWSARVGIHSPGWRSSGSVISPSLAPMMRMGLEMRATASSVQLGLASPTARGRRAARPAASYVRDYVAGMRRARAINRSIESLPEAFYGTYREPPVFSFLDRVDATVVVAESDILVDGKTVWQFEMPGWSEYERIRKELEAAGYESNVRGQTEASPDTDLIRGNRWVSISPSDEFLAVSMTTHSGREREGHRPEVAGVRYHVHFEERFSKERKQRLLREAIATGRLDVAMALYWHLPKEDLPGLLKALVDYPVKNPFETLVRARIADRAGDQEVVLYWTRRAVALSPVAMGHVAAESYETAVKGLAAELGLDPAKLEPETRADLTNAGVTDLGAGPAQGDLEVGSMLWFCFGGDSELIRGEVLIDMDEAGELRINWRLGTDRWTVPVPKDVGMAASREVSVAGTRISIRAERDVGERVKTVVKTVLR